MLIKKEIKQDNTFGGNYHCDMDYQNLPENYIEISEEQRDFIDTNLDKFRYDSTKDGVFETPKGVIDISETIEYQQMELKFQKEKRKQELNFEIEQLDKKRIRAICEPSMKNDGETWLEYYTSRINEKRQEIKIL